MARSAILLVALLALTGWIMSLAFRTEAERRALLVSGSLAAVVQLTAFGVVRFLGPRRALIGWGMGAVLRFTVLVMYALFFTKALGLPSTAALVGFAVFLFVSMLLESLLLANES